MAFNQLFVVDFQKAQQDTKPAGILDIQWGDSDAQFELLFSLPGSEYPPFKIIAAVQNVTDYPKNHEYIIFCEDDPPPYIGGALQTFCGKEQKTVSEFLNNLSRTFSGLHLAGDEGSLSTTAYGEGKYLANEDFSIATAYENSLHLGSNENSSSNPAYREGQYLASNEEDSSTIAAKNDSPHPVFSENSVGNTSYREGQHLTGGNEDSAIAAAKGDTPHPVFNENSLSNTALREEQHLASNNEESSTATAKDDCNDNVLNSTANEETQPPVDKDDSLSIAAASDSSPLSSDVQSLVSDDDSLSAIDCRNRLEADLFVAETAGFAVGYLGPIMDIGYGFVTVSIPMAELGISEEVMQVWEIDFTEHLILIIYYPKGYKTHEELQGNDGQGYDRSNIDMRVVAGKYPMPTLQEAANAFEKDKIVDCNISDLKTVRDIFISKQLSTMLGESLVPILRFRNLGLDWHGAESWFSDFQGMDESLDPNAIPDGYFVPETNNKAFPDIVKADHFSTNNSTNYSFPLLAMQFVLRHFVRCTEFCLTCHRKLNLDLEAIKPYYCERPMCLFQYLNSGLIEHEIVTQPYVVDLLISFCYSSARAYKLKEYPNGLALTVPFVESNSSSNATITSDANDVFFQPREYNVYFDFIQREIIFKEVTSEGCPVKKDSWIVIHCTNGEFHCRVAETSFYPVITFDEPIFLRGKSNLLNSANQYQQQPATSFENSDHRQATLTLYNVDFDLLGNNQKCDVICKLLDTLPTVKEMQTYLADCHPADLKSWVKRLSPAALRLFRWIIATNRACIMQVDSDNNDRKPFRAGQERLYGMKGYMQFRFAMGAPDKEQRFLNEVRSTAERLNLKYPTIFAWHGSPLYNWHMIIREGLNFDSVNHGRAYGNGVYHATDASTSETYSGMYTGLNFLSYGRMPSSGVTLPPSNSNAFLNSTTHLHTFNPNCPNAFPNNPNFPATSTNNSGFSPFLANTSLNSANTSSDISLSSILNSSNYSPYLPNNSNISFNSSKFFMNGLANVGSQSVPPNKDNFWPNSVLNVSSALALNEIVNAPQEFVSSNPYYVVAQLDWIQTRYLLVKCNPIDSVRIGLEIKPSHPHPQDPKRIPRGISGPIIIPASAITSGRGIMPKEGKKFEGTPGHFNRQAFEAEFASVSGVRAMSYNVAKRRKEYGKPLTRSEKIRHRKRKDPPGETSTDEKKPFQFKHDFFDCDDVD